MEYICMYIKDRSWLIMNYQFVNISIQLIAIKFSVWNLKLSFFPLWHSTFESWGSFTRGILSGQENWRGTALILGSWKLAFSMFSQTFQRYLFQCKVSLVEVLPWWVQSVLRHIFLEPHVWFIATMHTQVVGRYGALQNDALARVNGVASEVRMGMGSGICEGCWWDSVGEKKPFEHQYPRENPHHRSHNRVIIIININII